MRIRKPRLVAALAFTLATLLVASSATAFYFQNLYPGPTFPRSTDTIAGDSEITVTGLLYWNGTDPSRQMWVKIRIENFLGDFEETDWVKLDMTGAYRDDDIVRCYVPYSIIDVLVPPADYSNESGKMTVWGQDTDPDVDPSQPYFTGLTYTYPTID